MSVIDIGVWEELGFAKKIRTARIAIEPLAVRIIPAAPSSKTQRRFLLELPGTIVRPSLLIKAGPVG